MLTACSEPAPECWDESVKKLVSELGEEQYGKKIVGLEEIIEMEVIKNVTPQRRICKANLVTKYNEKEGTYNYYEATYTVRTVRGEYNKYYTSITNFMRI